MCKTVLHVLLPARVSLFPPGRGTTGNGTLRESAYRVPAYGCAASSSSSSSSSSGVKLCFPFFLRQSFPFNSRDVWVFIRYVTDCARLLLPSTARVPRETGWCGVAGQTLEFQVELTSSRGTARALAVRVICSLEWLCYICFVLLRTQEGRLGPHFRSGGRQPRPNYLPRTKTPERLPPRRPRLTPPRTKMRA